MSNEPMIYLFESLCEMQGKSSVGPMREMFEVVLHAHIGTSPPERYWSIQVSPSWGVPSHDWAGVIRMAEGRGMRAWPFGNGMRIGL